MKIKFKETIIRLLGIAFISAVLSDVIYGKSELANEYLIGQFIGQIFNISMALAVVLLILGVLYKVIFSELLDQMVGCPRMQSSTKKVRKVKTKRTKSNGGNKK